MEHPDWLGNFSLENLVYLVNNGSKIWIYYLNDKPICSGMIILADEEVLSKFDMDLNYKDVIEYGPMFVNPKYVEKILTFIVKEDKFVLLKGSDKDPQFHESFWYTVTGSVEKEDNSLEDAVKREAKEETNLEIERIKSCH